LAWLWAMEAPQKFEHTVFISATTFELTSTSNLARSLGLGSLIQHMELRALQQFGTPYLLKHLQVEVRIIGMGASTKICNPFVFVQR